MKVDFKVSQIQDIAQMKELFLRREETVESSQKASSEQGRISIVVSTGYDSFGQHKVRQPVDNSWLDSHSA